MGLGDMVSEFITFFETVLPNPLEKLLVIASLAIGWYFIKDFKSKTESSLKEIEPLKYLIEMLRSDMKSMRETIDIHRDTLGKANKGIKGDFLDLRKELIGSTEKMNGLINEVRYDFLDTQKDTVSIASNEKEHSWIRSRVDQNKIELEKTKDSIQKIVSELRDK